MNKIEDKMKIRNIKYLLVSALFVFLINNKVILPQGANNNSFVFNGSTSQLYVYDGVPANTGADQNGFKFFNSSASNKKITVQAWIYLIGDTPTDVNVPIIYRTVNNGKTFSLYIKNNKGYFSVGNNNSATVNTSELPAFQWIALTGTYDGNTLKIYSGGSLAGNSSFSITTGYSVTNGTTGLFVGKSNEGAFKGLIDEIRIFNTALSQNNINSSGGNGNPAENFPSSLNQYSVGQWSFTEISSGNLLQDLSSKKNYLRINDISQVVPSKKPGLLVVNSTGDAADSNPGDGSADVGGGLTTLRSAIQEANALAGSQIIYFYIPGSAPFTITPGSALPAITDPVFLDGTTQKGYAGLPLVNTSGSYGGLTISSGGSTIQGLSLSSSSGYGLTLSSNGGNNIVSNTISGISISSASNNINGNSITNSVNDGISISAGGTNNQIGVATTNNIFNNTGYGVSISDANGNQLKNNTINTNTLGGISLTNSAATVTGNTVSGNSANGVTVNGNSSILTSNIVNGNSGFGVVLIGGTGNQLTNNTVKTNTLGGISLNGSSTIFTGNTVNENSGFGLTLTGGTGNQLTNNTFIKNTLGGISVSNSSASITGNIISENHSFGVFLGSSNGSALTGNTISGNSGHGVAIQDGNNNTISANTISSNIGIDAAAADGIHITSAATSNNTIGGADIALKNIITGNDGFGIFINGPGQNEIASNNVQNNTLGGISLTNTKVNLSGNQVTGNSAFGISLLTSNGSNLSSNTISGNSGSGLVISGTDNVLANNSVSSNSGLGIVVNSGTGNQLNTNNITNNTLGGISISTPAANLTNNSVTGNSAAGISLNSNNSVLAGNTITDNMGNGVTVNGGMNVLSGNNISGNSNVGAEITGNFNNLGQNQIFNNTGDGVRVISGNFNKIFNQNLIYLNGGLGINLNESNGANQNITPPSLKVFFNSTSNNHSIVVGGLNNSFSSAYDIEFFKEPESTEAQTYLGTLNVVPDADGNAYLENEWGGLENLVAAGNEVTATATDASGNTSEFSAVVIVREDAGVHFKVNTTFNGIPLHWPDGNGTFTISPSITSKAGYTDAITKGFANWSEPPSPTASLLNYQQVNLTSTSNQWGGDPDGINNIVWLSAADWTANGLPVQAAAITRVRYNAITGEFFDVDIGFNSVPTSTSGSTYSWEISTESEKAATGARILDPENVATHEIGHYSGLADLYEPGDPGYDFRTMGVGNSQQTMYGRVGDETTKRSLFNYHNSEAHDHTTNWVNTEINDPSWDGSKHGDVAGIEYIYSHLDNVYYDIALVIDGSANFSSADVFNGFGFTKNGALSFTFKIKIQMIV